MSSSIKKSLSDIAKELRNLNKAILRVQPIATGIDSELQCCCPNCRSVFVATLPQGYKVINSEDVGE